MSSQSSSINHQSSAASVKATLLPAPVRITEQFWMEETVPVVSVFCWSYNHSKFIEKSISSILEQRTNFPVEAIIHDDASTDGTIEIIKQFELDHPQIFRNILQEKNQFSIGKSVMIPLIASCRGKYIALNHGDDFWTDPDKLQIQVDFLEKNPHFSCCFHRTKLVDENEAMIQQEYFVPDGSEFDFRDCLVKLKKKYATCSMVFKREALKNPKDWFLKSPTDMFLELQLALHGKIGFIDRNMGAYRKHGGGVWMGIPFAQRNLELLYRYQLLLDDPEIRESYGDEISHMIKKLERGFCLKTECAEILCKQSFFYRIAWFIDSGFQFIFRNAQNFKRSIFSFSKS